MGKYEVTFESVLEKNANIQYQDINGNILYLSNLPMDAVLPECLQYMYFQFFNSKASVQIVNLNDFLNQSGKNNFETITYFIIHINCISYLAGITDIIPSIGLKLCLEKIRTFSDMPIIVLFPEDSANPYDNMCVKNICDEFVAILSDYKQCYSLMLNYALSNLGMEQYYQYQKYFSYLLPYTFKAMLQITREICWTIRKISGMYKKCLVLDCDNILWGGILDEVGKEYIQLDVTFPGNQYYYFQKELLKLYQRGIILALCSKNNEEDVLNVFRTHPFMVLREKHIASYSINWQDKIDGIVHISNDLNISIEDMVFVDDSKFEVEYMHLTYPEMTCLYFDPLKPYRFFNILQNCQLFPQEIITPDDILRNVAYQQEKKRKKLLQNVGYEEYLASLQMCITKELVNELNLNRVLQLIKRTHRGNLTGKVYSHEQLTEMMCNANINVDVFCLADRFGDYGYIAVCLYCIEGDILIISDFYLSCRAFSRNVESLILESIFKEQNTNILKRVKYTYCNNGKNQDFNQAFNKLLCEKGFDVEVTYGNL